MPTDREGAVVTGHVRRLDQLPVEHARAVGGAKIGRLVELARAGLNLPPGFVVSVDAYRTHFRESGLDRVVDSILSALPQLPTDSQLTSASEHIRAAFDKMPLPEALVAMIVGSYEDLGCQCAGINLPVAVRSSASREDSRFASFAGIFETFLGVCGQDGLLDAIHHCWASLFSTRALKYCLEHGISPHEIGMAVGVLELIATRVSGVAFSLDPVTGKKDRIVIEGSWGLGEVVVQGHVMPDHVEVDKSDLRVLRYDVSSKTIALLFDHAAGRVVQTPISEQMRDKPVLDKEHIAAITKAVLAIEQFYGYPVDVEWVIPGHRSPNDDMYIVQARPVTLSSAVDGHMRAF